MAGFSKVIDAIGGADIIVEKRMYYYDPFDEGEVANNNGLINLKPGMQHMDGNTALQYVRFRHDEMGDIGRIERQQKFSKALLAQLASPAIITRIPSIIGEVSASIQTDLPVSQMLGLGKIINDAYKRGLNTQTVSGKPIYIDDISYWLSDIVAMRKQVAEIQGSTVDDKSMVIARRLATEYENSIPRETRVGESIPVIRKTTSPDKLGPSVAKTSTLTDMARVKVINASGQNAYSSTSCVYHE